MWVPIKQSTLLQIWKQAVRNANGSNSSTFVPTAPPPRKSTPMHPPEDSNSASLRLAHRVRPGPLLKVTAAAREAMLLNGLSLSEVLFIHTSTAAHALQGNRPGAEVVTQIALDSLGGLVITTHLGNAPNKNCTDIQLFRSPH